MKLLRNPIFTTGLVIVAIAVVCYQIMAPRMRFPRPVSAPSLLPVSPLASAGLSSARTNAVPGVKKTNPESLPSAGVDREYAELHFDGWVEWPQRDPFLLLSPDPEESAGPTETNSPVPTWKLRAIWAQTGSRMAVINRGWYREGDEIEGYRIDRIETGGVWFAGPHDKELLGFDTRPKPLSTNSPAGKPKP